MKLKSIITKLLMVSITLGALFCNNSHVKADTSHRQSYDVITSQRDYTSVERYIKVNNGRITYKIKEIGFIRANLSKSTVKELQSKFGKNNIKPSESISENLVKKRSIAVPETNFSYWPVQWDMRKVMENGKDYTYLPNSSKVTIGLVDSGIDTKHPALKHSIVKKGSINLVPKGGKDGKESEEKGDRNNLNDRLGHGTEVAGQIASIKNIRGVYPGVKLHIYRVLGKKSSDPEWIMKGIVDSANNKDAVVNVSLGTYNLINNKKNKLIYKAWQRAISYAYRKGSVVVASVGEDSTNEDNPNSMLNIYMKINSITKAKKAKGIVKDVPAALKDVVSVGSSSPQNTVSNFSNYGKNVMFFAPAGDTSLYYTLGAKEWEQQDLTDKELIATTDLNGSYTYAYGTSFATPKVSAIIAAYIAKHSMYHQPHKVIKLIERKIKRNKSGIRIISGKVLRKTY